MALGAFGEACVSLHSVMIYDRGGMNRLDQLVDVAEVEWVRERDQVTGARVVLSGRACRAQAPFLTSVAAMRHELVIFRGNDRVWEGPILEVRWFANRVELVAHDVFEYVNWSPLTKDWPNSDGGGPAYMTERAQQILEHELSTPYLMDIGAGPVTVPRWEGIDPPANVLPHLDVRQSLGSSGILTRSSTLAFEMTVGEHLRNLAEGGLDYTVIGRQLLVWDSARSIGRTRPVTDSDFYGDLQVIASGTDYGAIAHVSASRDESGEGPPLPLAVGNAGGVDDFYGVWTRLVSLASEEGSDTPNQLALNSQARRQLVGRSPVPTVILIPDGGLRLSHDLRINDLIPGVTIPVRATLNLRPVSQDQRLDKIVVTETPEGETVKISLSPAGALEAI